MHTLESGNLSVRIEPEMLETDADFSIDTLLKIAVRGDGFAANTTIDSKIAIGRILRGLDRICLRSRRPYKATRCLRGLIVSVLFR